MTRPLVVSCLVALMLGACDPPKTAGPVGAAIVDPPTHTEALPAPVAETVHRLNQIAEAGAYGDLARLASATPSFRSNNAGLDHAEYWNLKQRTGDWPMVQMQKVLGYRYAVEDSPQGKVYIWPYMAMLAPEKITAADARKIDSLLGRGQADALRGGAIWPGYVLGVREDGLWLYFISGSG